MNILFLNTTWICGGAEKVTNQILSGMARRGHRVYEIVCYNKRAQAPDSSVRVLYDNTPMLLFNRLLTKNHGNESLSIPYSRNAILRFIREHGIDLVHLHNAHGNFIGIRDVRRISELCPIIWTLHDFWALTGHCTYPTDCPDHWKTGCQACPRLQNYPPIRRDIAHRLLEEKSHAFKTDRITYAVPSKWMLEQFRQSHLASQKCVCIPNSLNTDEWSCPDKAALREKYEIPEDKHVLAFVAADPKKSLKGMSLLLEALEKIPNPNQYLLLIAGKAEEPDRLEPLGFSVKYFGYITEQQKMNEFYALSDLLVNPSVYETFGLVNIEAMASGTPVLVFPVCAMQEIVTPDAGFCCPEVSAESLSRTIQAAFTDPEALAEKGRAAARRVSSVFSETAMLDAYEEEYRKALIGR